jgi:hypothetical protein
MKPDENALTPDEIEAILNECEDDPNPHDYFNEVVLGRGEYWRKQKEICLSVEKYNSTYVPTGNAVGKTFLAAGVILSFLTRYQNSIVLATAPTQVQLEEVLWKEVERAYRDSLIPLGGRMFKSPLKIEIDAEWKALAYSTTKTERLSGHHAKDLLVVVDEASGVEPPIFEALDSLKPTRRLYIGNPLRPDGVFYDRCTSAESGKNPLANVIRIPSTLSPHIERERSPFGLADATWLEESRNDYGEGSLWWTCHVDALFPDSAEDTLIPRSWLDRAADAGREPFRRSGHPRMAVDLGLGSGGDRSVIVVRDDNGILDLWHSNTSGFEGVASRVALLRQKWGVAPHRVVYDVAGIGADFGNRLQVVGIPGARPYRGGNPGGVKFTNFRTASAWKLRQRLDPEYRRVLPDGASVPQAPFAVRPDWMTLMREELQGLRYSETAGGTALEPKEDFAARLKRSPDFADALIMSFGWSD